MDAREHAVTRFPWRLGLRLAPVAIALLLAWTYSDAFLHPTFFGDQGLRLDRADELVFDAGSRIWLPFLSAAYSCPLASARAGRCLPATRLDGQDDWRAAVNGALLPLRKEQGPRLTVVFVGVSKEEYLKFRVAPFLYDARTFSDGGMSLTAADVVVVPAGAQISSFVRR